MRKAAFASPPRTRRPSPPYPEGRRFNVWAAPCPQGDHGATVDSLRQGIRPHRRKVSVPGPRWKSARPDPHKSFVFCKTLNLQGFRTAGGPPGHLYSFPPADMVRGVSRPLGRCRLVAQVAGAISASNGRPLASTAQAIRASWSSATGPPRPTPISASPATSACPKGSFSACRTTMT